MNILILSWRDPFHPLAGGAERITQKYAEYWAKKGHYVVWLSGQFPNSRQNEQVNQVNYQRIGPMLSSSVLKNLFLYPGYLLNSILEARKIIRNKNIDKVIDEIHGLPFFTPLFASDKNVLLVCEVAGPIWDKMYPFPINIIGRLIETFCYKLYSSTQIWAISENTKRDIKNISNKASVKVIPLGIDVGNLSVQDKNNFPSGIFIARLVKMKGIEVAIAAAKKIIEQYPDFQLSIIGRGLPEYEDRLKNEVKKDGLDKNITFEGYVTEEKKFQLLSKSHFLLHPSYKEGFGLTVLEAGLVKTPAIVKSGSSLDELVTDSVDGFVVSDSDEMAEKFIQGYESSKYSQMSERAREKSLRYDWDKVLANSDEITGIK